MKTHILFLVLCTSISIFAQTAKQDPSTLYEKSLPAIVSIQCIDSQKRIWQGSGVILREDGIIATNYHVCNDAVGGRVKLSNGDIYDDVSITDSDERKDILILKIKAIKLPVMRMADSNALKVGSTVYAIGSPKGLEGTLSSGIISSLRSGDDFGMTGFRVIQFTAPVSSGSSGGALIDDSGNLVGLTTATRSDSQNINIAIPVNYVAALVNNSGTVKTLAKMSAVDPSEHKTTATTGTIADIAGTYIGSWASNNYDVSGTLVMTVAVANGVADITAVFTGSEYLNQDSLNATFTLMGGRIWKMDYKAKKAKLTGTGIFRDGKFVGDFKFKKYFWTDTGKWVLTKAQ